MGQILSQFCLMPELNAAYSELFSNKGAEFYSEKHPYEDEIEFAKKYFNNHNHALPITTSKNGDDSYAFYIAASSEDTATGGKLLWVSSPFFITDDFYSYNGELFMSALTMLCEKSSSISILGKAMQIQSLAVSTAAVAFWGAVWILVLPVGAVVTGLVIWNRRRKR